VSAPLLVRGDGWTVREAGPDDDAALCRLFADVHLKAALDLTQERDPSFFVLPRLHQARFATTAGFDDDGRLVGCGTLISRPGHDAAQDRVVETGYLCDLRVAPGFRGGVHLARAYGEVMRWAGERFGTELFTTVIFDSNQAARRALVERSPKRAEQPVYRPMTPFEMVSVQLTTPRPPPERPVRAAGPADRDALVEFLARQSRRRLLGEVLDDARFAERLALWPGLALEDFLLVHDARGAIVGACAPWDTSAFKRTRVLGYHGAMRAPRWAFDLAARVRGFATLPRPGDVFRFSFLTHLEVVDDDPAVLAALLRAAYAKLLPTRAHFFAVFLPRGSRLAEGFRGFTTTRTAMTLYAVHAPDSPWAAREVRTLHPGFEMALS
jgi:hypothetical protein